MASEIPVCDGSCALSERRDSEEVIAYLQARLAAAEAALAKADALAVAVYAWRRGKPVGLVEATNAYRAARVEVECG
jgi:ABC-type Fe3+-hydroxamate transport system substrate-binding protein